jgi:hypothetical protein
MGQVSPQLARSDFFLAVLNEPAESHSRRFQESPLARELYEALLQLAERVRTQSPCSPEEIDHLNHLFDKANAIQLQIVPTGSELDPVSAGPLGRASLRAFIRGHQGDRVYLEAIIGLLEALERGSLALSRCEECSAWYIPYSRAAITRFCSSRCRNRSHYRRRSSGQA